MTKQRDRGRAISRRAALVAGCLAAFAASGGALQGCLSPDNPLSDDALGGVGTAKCGEITYENFARAFCATYCLRCHSSTVTGDAARLDAPPGIDFDSMDGILEFSKRIRLRAGELGDMPPRIVGGPVPTEEERIKLMQWIDCGLPTDADVEAGTVGDGG